MTPEQMLRTFHASKAIHGGLMPGRPTADIPDWVRDLRMALLDEEVEELRKAVAEGDIVAIADALGDIEHVTRGTAVAYGIPSDAVFAEIFRSNMTKDNSPAEGKLVKGPGYEPPRIAEILGVPEPLTDVPMVCTSCRKPVMRSGEDWVHLHTADIGRCPHEGPVKAMVAAGNENVPPSPRPPET